MKINKEHFDKLENYGFVKVNPKEFENDDDPTLSYYEYYYKIGHARRGQFYFLLVGSNGELDVYASKAEGDGCAIAMPNILIELIQDQIAVPDKIIIE